MMLPVLAACSGLLLFLSDYPVHAWALQLFALIPFLLGLAQNCRSFRGAAAAGLLLGLCYTGPLWLVLRFPLVLGGGLVAFLSLLWLVMALCAYATLRLPPPLGGLATGAAVALCEWANITLLPVWGTAQGFARVWSAAPWAIQFVSLTGMTSLVFLLVAAQALCVQLMAPPRGLPRRLSSLCVLFVLTALPALHDLARHREAPSGYVRVAAMGWPQGQLQRRNGMSAGQLVNEEYRPRAEEAAGKGAHLLVTPEAGLVLSRKEREPVLGQLTALAKKYRITLAVGYFDRERGDNRIAFLSPDGVRGLEYRKTHLIPFVERYTPGDGTLVVVPLESMKLGGMICQDDNFTDLGRGYGRQRVGLLAVPTNDWPEVKDHHLENSLFRPLENGYGLVRAASGGISAIVSSHGQVVDRMDHLRHGPGLIVADLPLYPAGSIYSVIGGMMPLLYLLVLGVAIALRGRLRRQVPAARR